MTQSRNVTSYSARPLLIRYVADPSSSPRPCVQWGLCAVGRHAVVASHFPHFGEEDCLRGRNGSGTIFFAGCNLRCVFCQNSGISWQARGEPVSPGRLAAMMLALQDRGCHNINLVTPRACRAADPGGAATRHRGRAAAADRVQHQLL